MTDDVCGCSVSEKEEEESSTLTATKFWCLTAPEDKKQKENETPELYPEFESSVFLWWSADDGEYITLRHSYF